MASKHFGKKPVLTGGLTDRYLILLLFLTLVSLTAVGVGNVPVTCTAGLLLCAAGCLQGGVTVDLWVLLPLLAFNALSMASSRHAYGTVAQGFAPTQTVFTVLYLLMAHLEDGDRLSLRRLCLLWVGCAAALGIGGFALKALSARPGRLGGLLGNPNAFGIFLVLGWFALGTEETGKTPLLRLEPLILAALGMTLSMGSFLASAAGLLVSFWVRSRRDGGRKAAAWACRTLAKAAMGGGIGVLLYTAAQKTGVPWLCIPLAVYLLILAWDWPRFCAFLEDRPLAAGLLTGAGIAAAGAAVLLRPSAAATFAERLEMMGSALDYLFVSPLLGVGPYRWRLLDYSDGGTCFNTWYIHNLFLHIGVELGLPAMIALIAAVTRHFLKKGGDKAGSAALLVHCMMDTGFFFEAIPSLAILTAARPRTGGTRLPPWLSRVLFIGLGAVFAYDLLRFFR